MGDATNNSKISCYFQQQSIPIRILLFVTLPSCQRLSDATICLAAVNRSAQRENK